MHGFRLTPGSIRLLVPALLGVAMVAACSDGQPVAPREPGSEPARAVQAFTCVGSRVAETLSCAPAPAGGGGGSAVLIGGQGTYVRLASSNVSYDSAAAVFQFDVTVRNLMNEAIGTPDGTVADPDGIRVLFHSGPTVTAGTGAISVIDPDGTATFTAGGQPYFAYHEILVKDAVSSPRAWRLSIPGTVETFAFVVYVETDVQYLLVINEVMVNPAVPDGLGEWVEIHNAGTLPVQMRNLVITDSSASGRRPYHRIGSSLVVPPGGYVTLGNNTDPATNGGATVDYLYANIALANSLDAVKIARPYGSDTLDIDRTEYTVLSISYKNGITRELKNPSLDNSNMDGASWSDADTSAVFGPGSRGTPKARNSTFVP